MSRWLYRFEQRVVWNRRRRLAIGLLIGFLVLSLLDRTLYYWLYPGAGLEVSLMSGVREQLEKKDGIAALRTAGYLPAWVAVGTALLVGFASSAAVGREAARRRWGGLTLMAAAALAGAVAEILKPLVGRLRPMFTDGKHVYGHIAALSDSEISYGMASSHAAVAFGAAFAILFVYGGPGWVALAVAAGCGVTRMMTGAHFVTDVYIAAVLGYAFARLLVPREEEGLLLP